MGVKKNSNFLVLYLFFITKYFLIKLSFKTFFNKRFIPISQYLFKCKN